MIKIKFTKVECGKLIDDAVKLRTIEIKEGLEKIRRWRASSHPQHEGATRYAIFKKKDWEEFWKKKLGEK